MIMLKLIERTFGEQKAINEGTVEELKNGS